MKWTAGLDAALSSMLASSLSTQFVGEQLWLKVIGPPSCGKTTLMEGLATAKKWYLSRDTVRGFHSGAKAKEESDQPLAAMVNGKTLGTKDGDTLLKAPNLAQILAEGRALYDGASRTNYRNFVNNEYVGHRMTWHLAGTSSLREIDDSELGVRFLDVVVMHSIDDDFEDAVGHRAALQEAENMKLLSNGKPEAHYPQNLATAMATTGGFLDFLRTNAAEVMNQVEIDNLAISHCKLLGKFVAFMRARPPKNKGEEGSDREFSPRLIKQLTRMSMALAGALGKSEVDDECVSRTHKIAMDTARGSTLDIVKKLSRMPQGSEARGLSAYLQIGEDKLRSLLRFLRKIGVLEQSGNRWLLTERLSNLYSKVKHVN